jgi:hypothetical protein
VRNTLCLNVVVLTCAIYAFVSAGYDLARFVSWLPRPKDDEPAAQEVLSSASEEAFQSPPCRLRTIA